MVPVATSPEAPIGRPKETINKQLMTGKHTTWLNHDKKRVVPTGHGLTKKSISQVVFDIVLTNGHHLLYSH